MEPYRRNIPWDIEEAILLMELYIDLQLSTDNNYIDRRVLELSKILNYRAKILNLKVKDTFRNPNGIRMKLQNLHYLMSNRQKGRSGVSLMDKSICSLFNENRDKYDRILLATKQKYCNYCISNREENKLMEVFKRWLTKQNISTRAIESILRDLYNIQHDFCSKKAYQYLFITTKTKDVKEILRVLKSDKLYMMKNHISNNRLDRSLNMYLKFIQFNNYARKDKQIRLISNNTNFTQNSNKMQYEKVLKEFFLNGFRLKSSLELKKFRRRYSELIGNNLEDDDEKVTATIINMGIEHDGKIYLEEQMMNSSTAILLMSYIKKLFDEGKKTIFYDSLFNKFKDDFQGYCMYNEDMLKSYLTFVNQGNYYVKRSYISSDENDSVEPIDEIRKCMIENSGIYSYDELAELIPHIPVSKIKTILASSNEFVRNQKGSYFHADIIDLTEQEINDIESIIRDSINDKRYISGRELYKRIMKNYVCLYEKMAAFSESGIRGIIAYKLRERFSFNGNIISEIDEYFSTANVYAQYCKSKEKFTLDDLNELKNEIGSGIIYFDTVYSNSLRINDMEFVSKKYAQFDISAIDKIIGRFCIGEYVPIAQITQFSLFPTENFRWNSFLLEHYVYEYSYQFKILNKGFNLNKCIGVIVRKTSDFKGYDDVLADAIAHGCASLKSKDVLDYLYNKGYIGKRSISNIDKVITNAKKIRMKKGQ